MDWTEKVDLLTNSLVAWAPKLLSAILVLIIGFWIVGWIVKIIRRAMDRSNIDKDIQPFLLSLCSVILKVLVVITAAGVVGVEVTAFAALIAASAISCRIELSIILGASSITF